MYITNSANSTGFRELIGGKKMASEPAGTMNRLQSDNSVGGAQRESRRESEKEQRA